MADQAATSFEPIDAHAFIQRARQRLKVMTGGPLAGEVALGDRPGVRMLSRAVVDQVEEAQRVSDGLSTILRPGDPTTGPTDAEVKRATSILERTLAPHKAKAVSDPGSLPDPTRHKRSVVDQVAHSAHGIERFLDRIDHAWEKATEKVPVLKAVDDGMKALTKRLGHTNQMMVDLAVIGGASVNAAMAFAKYGTSAALPYVELGLVAVASACAGASYLRSTTPRPMTDDETAVLDRMRGQIPEKDFQKFLASNDLTMREAKDGTTTYYRPPEMMKRVDGKEARDLKRKAETMDPAEFDAFLKSNHISMHSNGVAFFTEPTKPGEKPKKVTGKEAKALLEKSQEMDDDEFRKHLAENGYSMRATGRSFYLHGHVDDNPEMTFYENRDGKKHKLSAIEAAHHVRRSRRMEPEEFKEYLADNDLEVRTRTSIRASERPGSRFLNSLYDAMPVSWQKSLHSDAAGKLIKVGSTVAGIGHVAVVPFTGFKEAAIGVGAGAAAVLALERTAHRLEHEEGDDLHHPAKYFKRAPADHEATPYYKHHGVDYRLGRHAHLSPMETKDALKAMGLNSDAYSAALLRQRRDEQREGQGEGAAAPATVATAKETPAAPAEEGRRRPFFMRGQFPLPDSRTASSGA